MSVSFRNLPNGRSALTISKATEPGKRELAAPLILSARVDDVTHDRLWVAAIVCFGKIMMRGWPTGPAISEAVFQAASDYLEGDGLFYVSNIVRETPEYKIGVSAKIVRSNGLFSDDARSGVSLGENFMVLETVPLGDWSGALFSLHHYLLATNSHIHDRTESGTTVALGTIAAAVLLSNDLSIDELCINSSDISPDEFERLHKLLSAVGLKLVLIN